MNLIDTRTGEKSTTSEAIIRGIAPSGGLFAPDTLPFYTQREIESLAELNYKQLASRLLTDLMTDIDSDYLSAKIDELYSSEYFAAHPPVTKLATKSNDIYILELYHGPTLAFKDYALQALPILIDAARHTIGKPMPKQMIITATSGDTGKAALSSFADKQGFACVVFYPENGVSHAQLLQMTTQRGANVAVCAVRGNFDDAQRAVKKMFRDESLHAYLNEIGYAETSANSINFGRLAPQIVYYFSVYLSLVKLGAVKLGDPIDVVVPTGNFGNILACLYAKRMGLAIDRVTLAANENNVLHDFIQTGIYDAKRDFRVTNAPAMDILVSSNLERFLFEICSRDVSRVAHLMKELAQNGRFQITCDEHARLRARLSSGWASEAQVRETIKYAYERGSLIDTHTAVGLHVARGRNAIGAKPTILASTASPFKFAGDVYEAITGDRLADFEVCDALARMTRRCVPSAILELEGLPVLHTDVRDIDEMTDYVKQFAREQQRGR